jgi:hypothetical protein
MLAGEYPFRASSLYQLFETIAAAVYTPLPAGVGDDAGVGLGDALLGSLLARDPNARPAPRDIRQSAWMAGPTDAGYAEVPVRCPCTPLPHSMGERDQPHRCSDGSTDTHALIPPLCPSLSLCVCVCVGGVLVAALGRGAGPVQAHGADHHAASFPACCVRHNGNDRAGKRNKDSGSSGGTIDRGCTHYGPAALTACR